MLLVALAEPGEEHLGFVCLSVSIGVASEQDIGGGTDEGSVAPRHHAAGVGQGVEKNGRVIIASVIVAVFEDPDAAARFSVVVQAKRVIGHLCNPEAPVFVPFERHRIHHQRFADHEFDLVAGQGLDCLGGVFGGFWQRHHAAQEFVERSSVNEIWQMCGILVLYPEMVGMKPGSVDVVLPTTDNHRDGVAIASEVGHDFARPAHTPTEDRLGHVEVKRIPDFVGVNDVEVAVLVDVDKAHSVVASIFADDVDVFRQIEGGRQPFSLALVPFQDRLALWVADDDFAHSVVVCVAKSHSVVPSGVGGLDRLATDLQPLAKRLVFLPFVAVEVPDAADCSVTDEHRGVAAWLQNAEPGTGVGAIAVPVDVDQPEGERGSLPALGFRIPEPCLLHGFVSNDCIHEAIVVEVEKSHAVVLSVLCL